MMYALSRCNPSHCYFFFPEALVQIHAEAVVIPSCRIHHIYLLCFCADDLTFAPAAWCYGWFGWKYAIDQRCCTPWLTAQTSLFPLRRKSLFQSFPLYLMLKSYLGHAVEFYEARNRNERGCSRVMMRQNCLWMYCKQCNHLKIGPSWKFNNPSMGSKEAILGSLQLSVCWRGLWSTHDSTLSRRPIQKKPLF